MLWIFYLFAFTVVPPRTGTCNELFNNSGWTPITKEKVFGGLRRKVTGLETAEDVYNRNQNNVAAIENGVSNEDVIQKMIEPRFANSNAKWDRRGSSDKNKLNETESNEENYENIVSHHGGYRKPKVISKNYSIHAINNLASADIDNVAAEVDHEPKEEFIEDASANRYEVTETSEVEDLLKQRAHMDIHLHTSDQIDKLNETERVHLDNTNDFTSKFLSILSNYNIRVNDDLPNYELSRNFKRNPPKEEFVLLPIPLRYSSKYNNLHVFGLDPMLVVFLSKHGYFLPGQFRARDRYHNLYGHLNYNIHYNDPFRSYRVYLDTDSSQ